MYFSEDSLTTTDTDAEYAPSTSSEPHFPTKNELQFGKTVKCFLDP